MSAGDIWNYDRCSEAIIPLRGRLGFPDAPVLEFLRIRLDLATGILTNEPGGKPVPELSSAVYCILHTYSRAEDIPESFRLCPFRELPGGTAYESAFHVRAVLPLASLYSRAPEAFHRTMEFLGGVPLAYADHAWKLYALPRVPVFILIWDRSDEFTASSALLFDASVAVYLETETTAMLGEMVTQRIAYFLQKLT